MINNIKTKIYFISLSFFIILIDQFTKYIIFFNYQRLINLDFLFFKIDYVKNYGAAFNIFNGSRVFLSIVSIIFSIIILYLILRNKKLDLIYYYSYSLILGGTFGNGIDRIIKGYVIDFINLNIINFPVFNISDLSINIGFILILYSIFKHKK